MAAVSRRNRRWVCVSRSVRVCSVTMKRPCCYAREQHRAGPCGLEANWRADSANSHNRAGSPPLVRDNSRTTARARVAGHIDGRYRPSSAQCRPRRASRTARCPRRPASLKRQIRCSHTRRWPCRAFFARSPYRFRLVCCPVMNFDNSRGHRAARQGARRSRSGATATPSNAASRFEGK